MKDREIVEVECSNEVLNVKHPPDLKPEEWARFVELTAFSKSWKKLNLTDEDRRVLQVAIMTAGDTPVIPGTGGLRKIRFTGKHWNKGKRGGARVCYAYFSEYSVVFLVTIYLKADVPDLTPKERKEIKKLLTQLRLSLAKGIKYV